MKTPTLFQPGNSIFHRLDSRPKLFFLISMLIVSFLFFNPFILIGLALLGFLMNVKATGKYAFNNALTKLFIWMTFFFTILHGFANPSGKTPIHILGFVPSLPFFGPFTMEGAYYGFTFGLRVMSIAFMGLLYISTTHPTDLVRGLVKLGVSHEIGFMILMSLQLIPISARETQIIVSAQRARGLIEKTLWDKIKGLFPLFVPLAISSMERMETMAMALETRAFGITPSPTSLYDTNFGQKDRWAIIGVVLFTFVALAIYLQYGNFNLIRG